MKILSILGRGHQEDGPRNASGRFIWQAKWERRIGDGLRRWNSRITPHGEFLPYDDLFYAPIGGKRPF